MLPKMAVILYLNIRSVFRAYPLPLRLACQAFESIDPRSGVMVTQVATFLYHSTIL